MKISVRALCTIMLINFLISTLSIAGNNLTAGKNILNENNKHLMKNKNNSSYLPGRVIVKMREEGKLLKGNVTSNSPSLTRILNKYSITSIENYFPQKVYSKKERIIDLTKFFVINYSSVIDPFDLCQELMEDPDVEYAEPWFIHEISDINSCPVNDQYRYVQWCLNKILADTAWCISTGNNSVVIAVVDNGVQIAHPDLSANIYINQGEYGEGKESNGYDDDGNGFIDDWRGWDFAGADLNNPVPDNDPTPTSSSHGSHVSGIAAAIGNNSTGVAGVAYSSKVLAVKTASDNTPNTIAYGMSGILYASIMGADVINCSWGGPGSSLFEQEIIDSVTAWGSLVVAAAGNDASAGNPYHYPASYRGVMSVTAVDSFDQKPSYAEYNELVDVAAPGEKIFSTNMSSSYDYLSGTSMAAAFGSGTAALVKSVFPSYTVEQVREQVRVTADNINSVNPGYANLLGKGRINALNALTLLTPSIRMISVVIRDSANGNGNGVLEPNEEADLIMTFKNYLQPTTASAYITLSCADTNVEILHSLYPIKSVPTLTTVTNQNNPFQIMIKQNPPPGHVVRFTLTMSDAGYSDVQVFTLLINPTFATHDINNVRVTLTNIGRIGYVDLTNTFGEGFVFGGGNQLYEGGIIMGYSSTKIVNNIRNSASGQDADFTSSMIYNLTSPGVISSQDGNTYFTDASAPVTNRLGISIDMYSYAFTTPADSNYVILRYDIRNISGATINGLYFGLFFDWDMLPDYSTNKTAYDPSRSLGYAWDTVPSNPIYCGARALEGAASYTGLLSTYASVYTRSAKYSWISGGIVPYNNVDDIHFVISSGPYSLAPDAKQMVGFAVIGGTDLANLQASADAALTRWNEIKTLVGVEEPESIPKTFALNQNYPNPFNPATTINFDLPKQANVSLKLYDITGREVATILEGMYAAGSYSIPFNASNLSSGVYFYKLIAGEYFSVRKLVLLK